MAFREREIESFFLRTSAVYFLSGRGRAGQRMFQVLAFGLETHAKGLPAWMAVKDIDHLSTKERRSIVSP